MSDASPARILEVAMGFWPAKTLLAAIKLGVFGELGEAARTGRELCAALGLHERAHPDFFDALLALGFLEREGEGEGARYRNTEETRRFLDRKSPEFMGGFLEMANDRLYRHWGDLEEGLRTGKPQSEIKHTGTSFFETLYGEPERLEQFLSAMSGISSDNFRAFAERFDLTGFETVSDVGGADGSLSIVLASQHPQLRCTTLDLPVVVPIAERRIAEAGLGDRVKAQALDFFAEPIPPADLVTMGLILHDWNLEKKRELIAKAHAAVKPGGAFVVIEQLIDDARRENAFGLLMSLNMLIELGDGFDYTGADFRGWCLEAGFARCEVLPLGGSASAGIAWKARP